MAALGLDLRIGPAHRAVALDLAARRLRLLSGDTVEYDGLVLATGSAARRLPAINDLPGAYVLRTLDDALALRTVLQIPGCDSGSPGRALSGSRWPPQLAVSGWT